MVWWAEVCWAVLGYIELKCAVVDPSVVWTTKVRCGKQGYGVVGSVVVC